MGKIKKRWQKNNKKKIIIVLIVAAVALLAAGGYGIYSHKQAEKEAAEAQKEADEKLAQEKKDAEEDAENEAKDKSSSTDSLTSSDSSTSSSSGSGKIVCIDPGHQAKGESAKEANGPGSSTMKARVTGGTTGRYTGIPEYQEVLTVGLALKTELEKRGYTVVMTRTTSNVSISNVERAQIANNAGADICVRLHCNGVDNSSTSGALTMATSSSNPYCSAYSAKSQALARALINAYCAATGMNNQGVTITDTMTGLNWCKMPCTIIEMGYMTNQSDDYNLNSTSFQAKMVQGIANGIDNYFAQN